MHITVCSGLSVMLDQKSNQNAVFDSINSTIFFCSALVTFPRSESEPEICRPYDSITSTWQSMKIDWSKCGYKYMKMFASLKQAEGQS